MNSQTKNRLKLFLDAVDQLAYGVMLNTGQDTVKTVLEASSQLRVALDSDETILEVR